EYVLGGNGSTSPRFNSTPRKEIGCSELSRPSQAGSDHTGRNREIMVSTGELIPGTDNARRGDILREIYTWTGDQLAGHDTCLLHQGLSNVQPSRRTYEYDQLLRLKSASRSNFATAGGSWTDREYHYDS